MTGPRSTIPAVLDAILADLTAALAADAQMVDVQLIDGQPLNLENDYIAIGFTPDPQSMAVNMSQTPSNASLTSNQESYDIAGEVSSWNGDTEQKVARDRVFDLLAVVEGVLTADRHPADIGGPALLTAGGLIQGVAGQGAVATIPFTIHIEAWK